MAARNLAERWRLQLAVLCGVVLMLSARAADTETSDEFLEYLGNVEDEFENWTDLFQAADDKSSSSHSASQSSRSSSRLPSAAQSSVESSAHRQRDEVASSAAKVVP